MGQKLEDIRPRRVALVKRGANLRRILFTKGDGNMELDPDVAGILEQPVAKEDTLLATVRDNGGDESVEKAAATVARSLDALMSADWTPEQRDLIVKAAKQMLDPDEDGDNDTDASGDMDDDMDEMAKEYETVIKRTFTADERKKLADSGAAMPNGSYPIENKDDLSNAIHAIGRGNNPHAQIRAHIIRRAKALGATSMLPDEWNVNKEDDGMTETAQAVPVKKEDGTWDLSAVPEEHRPAFEALAKAYEDEKAEAIKKAEEETTRAENAEKIAKAVQEKIEKAEYVAKAEGFDNLAKSADELGVLLYEVAKAEENGHLSEGTSAKLDEVLKGANEAAQHVFKEAGKVGRQTGDTDPMVKLEKAAEELMAADSTLTKPQAITKALAADKSLYDDYQKAA